MYMTLMTPVHNTLTEQKNGVHAGDRRHRAAHGRHCENKWHSNLPEHMKTTLGAACAFYSSEKLCQDLRKLQT